ncbi:MAG TPA: NHL repeat-containing protein [Longimicrobiales bacterium]|nr:NHL repeat-containing protein [Longimicrobiales bacterium]
MPSPRRVDVKKIRWTRACAGLLAAGLVLATCTDDQPFGLDGTGDGSGTGEEVPLDSGPSLPSMWVENMRSPLRIAAVSDALLVTDSRRQLVVQLNPRTMDHRAAIYIDGKPLGVAYLSPHVFVGNAKRQTVEIYEGRGGRRVGDFRAGRIGYPSDIAVDFDNARVLVVDGRDKVVKVFTPTGRQIFTIGGPGGGALFNPIGVAVDSARREILVSDYGDLSAGGEASVVIYGLDGEYRTRISGAGRCDSGMCVDGFSRPQGLAVGHDGRIYVADALLGKVLVYDRESLSWAGEIGDRENTPFPTDVAVGDDGDLYIVINRTQEVRALRGATAR